jgi:heme/copper-type cytochrome/quinol oxidase subunit 3
MEMTKKNTKVGFKVFFLSAIYYTLCFFIFIFFVNNVIIELVTSGKINISQKELLNLCVISTIVGVAAGCRVWILAKIRARKNCK